MSAQAPDPDHNVLVWLWIAVAGGGITLSVVLGITIGLLMQQPS